MYINKCFCLCKPMPKHFINSKVTNKTEFLILLSWWWVLNPIKWTHPSTDTWQIQTEKPTPPKKLLAHPKKKMHIILTSWLYYLWKKSVERVHVLISVLQISIEYCFAKILYNLYDHINLLTKWTPCIITVLLYLSMLFIDI